MNRAVLQVPLDPALRIAAEKSAAEQGFSSLQDAVRVFLKQMADKAITLKFRSEPEAIQLSPKAIKRYNKIIDEIESGEAKTVRFDSVDKMMAYLNK